MEETRILETVNTIIDNYKTELEKLMKESKDKFHSFKFKTKENSVQLSFNVGNQTIILNSYRMRTPDVWTTGTLNHIPETNNYILFMDYDLVSEEFMKGELLHLQRVYPYIGSIDVFKSSEKGYHVRSYSYLNAKEFLEIINNSACDWAFKNIPRFSSYRNWVLRDSSKGETDSPKFLYTLKGDTKRLQSSAHHKWTKILYKNIQELQNPDNKFDLEIIHYETGKNVDIKKRNI